MGQIIIVDMIVINYWYIDIYTQVNMVRGITKI